MGQLRERRDEHDPVELRYDAPRVLPLPVALDAHGRELGGDALEPGLRLELGKSVERRQQREQAEEDCEPDAAERRRGPVGLEPECHAVVRQRRVHQEEEGGRRDDVVKALDADQLEELLQRVTTEPNALARSWANGTRM